MNRSAYAFCHGDRGAVRISSIPIASVASVHPSVSNSMSGRDWELDEVPAVGDPTHLVQIGVGHRVSTREGQRRVALQ